MGRAELAGEARTYRHVDESYVVFALILVFLASLCLSMVWVAFDVSKAFHIRFESHLTIAASLPVILIGAFATPFALARFSFGYVISFYFLVVTAGYLWLSAFTPLEYDHGAARISAVLSFCAFLLPALLTKRTPIVQALSVARADAIVLALLISSAIILAWAASFNFNLIGVYDAEEVRARLVFPRWLSYAIPIALTSLLPFCFAWFAQRRRYAAAALTSVLALAFYPVTLTKTALIAPFWILFLFLLFRFYSARTVVVLSLLMPMVAGIFAQALTTEGPNLIFRAINFRMFAIPASGLDHYYHFFSQHSPTIFCQISIIGKLFSCELPEQLGVMMAREYTPRQSE